MTLQIADPEEEARIPNPGTGEADPRLAAALLTSFRLEQSSTPAVPYLPGAAVRFPVRDTGSRFIGLRQVGSPFSGPSECSKWTSGMWFALITDFNTPGVQLGVERLDTTSRLNEGRGDMLMFSEAIIAGPASVVDTLADDRIPGSCTRLSFDDRPPGKIEPLPAPRTGDRARAYRIVDAKGFVWHWVEVIRFGTYLIEIRIPNQGPAPSGDMVSILHQAAAQAYAKAARTLS